MIATPLDADAQERAQRTAPHWADHFEDQMTEVLTSGSRGAREDALQMIRVLQQRDPRQVNLRALTPALLDVLEDRSAPESVRTLALSALGAMEHRGGYDALEDWVESDPLASEHLRRQALRALTAYQDRLGMA